MANSNVVQKVKDSFEPYPAAVGSVLFAGMTAAGVVPMVALGFCGVVKGAVLIGIGGIGGALLGGFMSGMKSVK